MATRRRKTGPKTPTYSEEETREALLAFNAAVARQGEERRVAKRKARADRARTEAADEVKRVNADPRSTPEERSAAEQAYRDAVEAWGRIERGEPDPEPEPEPAVDEQADDVQRTDDVEGDADAGESEAAEGAPAGASDADTAPSED